VVEAGAVRAAVGVAERAGDGAALVGAVWVTAGDGEAGGTEWCAAEEVVRRIVMITMATTAATASDGTTQVERHRSVATRVLPERAFTIKRLTSCGSAWV
jgi:hypothetical protein